MVSIEAARDDAAALALLGEALEWPEAERDEKLLQSCAGDQRLYQRVRHLLVLSSRGPAFLPTQLPAGSPVDPDAADVVKIGVYRLTAILGIGGMGAVWRGEREDGLFQQTVAIKRIRPGLKSPEITARFASERRILAMLHHPNIAQILDGGTDQSGTPFFVMDYLPGEPINSHALDHKLPLATMLDLFMQVCDAVQYAHQNLIVHADIKPSNIVVLENGQVKLLDFGIARIVDPAMGAVPRDDQSEPMTRAYAAPERVGGTRPSVASDVYSLGVLLYELLVGRLPGNLTETGTATTVVEGSPTAAWRLASRAAADEKLTAVSPSELKGDLDAIILRALAPDPQHRYPSVSALQEDVRRHRRHEPISAMVPSLRYSASRFLRRHRAGVAITAAVLASLAVTSGLSLYQYFKAETARAAAAERFEEVRSLARFMIFDLYDDLGPVPGTVLARAHIAQQSQRYLNYLADAENAGTDVGIDAGRSLIRLAEIQGLSASSNLGDPKNAIENLARAESLLTESLKQNPARQDIRIDLSHVREIQCNSLIYADHDAEAALRRSREAKDILAAIKELSGELRQRSEIASVRAVTCEGDALTWLNRSKESVPLLTALWIDTRKRWRSVEATPELRLVRARLLRMLGEAHYYDSNLEAAALYLGSSRDQLLEGLNAQPQHPDYNSALTSVATNLGAALFNLGRRREALETMFAGREAAMKLQSLDTNDLGAKRRVLSINTNIAMTLAELGRVGDAKKLIEATHDSYKKLISQSPNEGALARAYARSIRPRGVLYERSGDMKTACHWYGRAKTEWQSFDRRWGITDSDKKEEVAALDEALKKCS
jgi:eukaryotic-like serine/threonine-protein kinase